MDSKITFGVLLVALMALCAKCFNTSTSNDTTTLCSDRLPCRWHVYDFVKDRKRVYLQIANDNCICGPKRKCEVSEDNPALSAFVLRCVDIELTTTTTTTTESSGTESSKQNLSEIIRTSK